MGFFGVICCFTVRVNLSVALLTMINNTYLQQQETEDTNGSHVTSACFAANFTNAKKDDGVFKWNSNKQGVVLGSFYYGYIMTPFVSGVLAMKFGGKLLMLVGQTSVAVLTILTPVLTTIGDFPVLVILRILKGFGQGLVIPAFVVVLSRWTPPDKTASITAFAFAGAPVGIVLGKAVTGLITDLLGWQSSFYLFGGVTVVWVVVWFFVAYDIPADHPRITKAELDYLTAVVQQSTVKKGSTSVPWRSIFTSVRIWAIAIAHFSAMWGFFTMKLCLPMYYKEILYFDITTNGVVSGAPFLALFIIQTLSGITVDALVTKTRVSVTVVKKLAVFLGLVLPACCLVAVGYIACNVRLAVLLIVLGIGSLGMATSITSGSNQLDIAPSHAGTLVACTLTLSVVSGLIGPSVVTAITNNNHTVSTWRTVFFISACTHVFGAVFYAVFGTARRQSWATTSPPDQTRPDSRSDTSNVD